MRRASVLTHHASTSVATRCNPAVDPTVGCVVGHVGRRHHDPDPGRDRTTTHAPSDVATAWLEGFEAALAARDIAAAAEMFATESYWRDLVSFSWNITTVEGREGVTDLLTSTLDGVDPSGFRLDEPADEADGVVTAWFVFETALGRGRGLLRLVEEDGRRRAFTFLTTLYELKGHEEPRNEHRPRGAEHGADKKRRTWLERQQEEAESLGSTTQPYVLVIGGGSGRHRPRRAAAPARRTEPGDRQAPATRRPVAQPLQVALPARPGLVRPPALPEVPGQLAGLRAQGQDRRLARVLHEDHGGALLVEHDGHQRVVLGRDG